MGISDEERAKLKEEVEKLKEEVEKVQRELEQLRLELHGPDAPDAPQTAKERELGEKLRQLVIRELGLAEE